MEFCYFWMRFDKLCETGFNRQSIVPTCLRKQKHFTIVFQANQIKTRHFFMSQILFIKTTMLDKPISYFSWWWWWTWLISLLPLTSPFNQLKGWKRYEIRLHVDNWVKCLHSFFISLNGFFIESFRHISSISYLKEMQIFPCQVRWHLFEIHPMNQLLWWM